MGLILLFLFTFQRGSRNNGRTNPVDKGAGKAKCVVGFS